MKIFIDQFCLSNGGEESPRTLLVNGEREVQTVPLLRGGSATVFPRGNRVNTLTFAVTRTHASYGEAEGFLFRHAAELPAAGQLILLCEPADGGGARYTATAAVSSDQGSQAGLATTHQYKIVCGEIAAAA